MRINIKRKASRSIKEKFRPAGSPPEPHGAPRSARGVNQLVIYGWARSLDRNHHQADNLNHFIPRSAPPDQIPLLASAQNLAVSQLIVCSVAGMVMMHDADHAANRSGGGTSTPAERPSDGDGERRRVNRNGASARFGSGDPNCRSRKARLLPSSSSLEFRRLPQS